MIKDSKLYSDKNILPGPCHKIKGRIYYADTDFSGVVYHARYLEFLERGRSEWLRAAGISHRDLIEPQKGGESLAFAIRHMAIDFVQSAKIDDLLLIATSLVSLSGARIIMQQEIWRCDSLERASLLLVKAKVELALLNDKGRVRRFPLDFYEKLQERYKILPGKSAKSDIAKR